MARLEMVFPFSLVDRDWFRRLWLVDRDILWLDDVRRSRRPAGVGSR